MNEEEWQNDRGERHRVDGPAYLSYTRDGTVTKESWWREGQVHREDGPAVTTFYPDGFTHEIHYRFGARHRDDGPADFWRDPQGGIYDAEETTFFLHGEKIHPEEFAKFAEAIESGAPEEWARAYAFGPSRASEEGSLPSQA